MATYEAYLGGSRQQNPNFAMLPAAPFVADSTVQPAVRQRPISVFPARDLNFGTETALMEMVRRVPLVSGDKLGAQVIPANFLAMGFYWIIKTVNAGGTFAAATRVGGTSLVSATTTGTLNSAYVTWPSGPVLFKTSDIIDVTFGTVPAGGMGALDLQIGVLGFDLRIGQW